MPDTGETDKLQAFAGQLNQAVENGTVSITYGTTLAQKLARLNARMTEYFTKATELAAAKAQVKLLTPVVKHVAQDAQDARDALYRELRVAMAELTNVPDVEWEGQASLLSAAIEWTGGRVNSSLPILPIQLTLVTLDAFKSRYLANWKEQEDGAGSSPEMYHVFVDGVMVGATPGNVTQLELTLADGQHYLSVKSVNAFGTSGGSMLHINQIQVTLPLV